MEKTEIQNIIMRSPASDDKRQTLLKLLDLAENGIKLPQTLPFQPLFGNFDIIIDISSLALVEYLEFQLSLSSPSPSDYQNLKDNITATAEDDWNLKKCSVCRKSILPKERIFTYPEVDQDHYWHYRCFLDHEDRDKLSITAAIDQQNRLLKKNLLLYNGLKVSIYSYDLSLDETPSLGFLLFFRQSLSKIIISDIPEYDNFCEQINHIGSDYEYLEELALVKSGIKDTDEYFHRCNGV
jgi:hypothetical protein